MVYIRTSAALSFVVLFAMILLSDREATAQIDSCHTKTQAECEIDPDCHYCPIEGEYGCKDMDIPCTECINLDETNCESGVGCYWCPNKLLCLEDGESCTCGDGFLQPDEECDNLADPNCVDCICINNSIADGMKGCCTGCMIDNTCVPLGEASLTIDGQCQTCDPSVSQTSWTTMPCTCGDGLLTDSEQCDDPADQNCVDCICVNDTIPGPETGCCTGCMIENTCVAAGEVHPEDECRSCDPAIIQTNWSDNGECFALPLFIPSIIGQGL